MSSFPSASLPTPSALPRGILLTNDDGPPGKYAPFLLPFTRCLKRRLAQLYTQSASTATSSTSTTQAPAILVCTPSDQQSWVGKAITRFAQVKAHTNYQPPDSATHAHPSPPPAAAFVNSPGADVGLWATVDGTPSTTANVALHTLAPFPIDLCLSGPNLGRNTGRSFILSSGTVGGAMEAAFAGIRSIAISFAYFSALSSYTDAVVECACEVAVDVVLRLWAEWGEGVELYNVNVPLGCKRDVSVYHTHLLQDHYGAIYAPASHRQLVHPDTTATSATDTSTESTVVSDDSTKQEILTSPLPLPSAASLPPASPTLSVGVNGYRSAASPVVPVAVAGVVGEVSELSHVVDYRFNIEMFREWSSVAGYAGSDYCVVKEGNVSVSALRGSLAECEWRSPSYSRYGEDGERDEAVSGSSGGGANGSQHKSAL